MNCWNCQVRTTRLREDLFQYSLGHCHRPISIFDLAETVERRSVTSNGIRKASNPGMTARTSEPASKLLRLEITCTREASSCLTQCTRSSCARAYSPL